MDTPALPALAVDGLGLQIGEAGIVDVSSGEGVAQAEVEAVLLVNKVLRARLRQEIAGREPHPATHTEGSQP